MAFDVNNFIVDHILRGYMTAKSDGSYMWSVNQITNPSLSITSDTEQAVDALGTPIATFNRGKEAEFSAENSIFDLGLFAAQNGTNKQVADSTNTIECPMFEEITATGTSAAIALKKLPLEDITEIYELKGDGTLSTVYTASTTAGENTFVYSTSGGVGRITLQAYTPGEGSTPATGVEKGTKFFVRYKYAATEAVAVQGTAIEFPKQGEFIMEVLGTDTCDTTTLIHAYLIFPNAKLDAEFDIDFATDGTHPFTIIAQQDYCDNEKVLYKLIIPKED